MKRFVEGDDLQLTTLFSYTLDNYVTEDNPIRGIDVFIEELPPSRLGYKGTNRKQQVAMPIAA